jgi:hypothetical protein
MLLLLSASEEAANVGGATAAKTAVSREPHHNPHLELLRIDCTPEIVF